MSKLQVKTMAEFMAEGKEADILFWVGSLISDMIGYGWVGSSKKGQKSDILYEQPLSTRFTFEISYYLVFNWNKFN